MGLRPLLTHLPEGMGLRHFRGTPWSDFRFSLQSEFRFLMCPQTHSLLRLPFRHSPIEGGGSGIRTHSDMLSQPTPKCRPRCVHNLANTESHTPDDFNLPVYSPLYHDLRSADRDRSSCAAPSPAGCDSQHYTYPPCARFLSALPHDNGPLVITPECRCNHSHIGSTCR